MSDRKPYNDSDSELFASLMSVPGKRATGLSRRLNTNAPNIQTRPTYTDKDLKKFEKMFSAGFAPKVSPVPDRDSKTLSEGPKVTNDTFNYQVSDKAQFEKLASTVPVKKQVAQVAPGGRIGDQKTRSVYTQADQEQFDQLLGESSKTRMLTQRNQPGVAAPNERKWRFPELHQNSQSELSPGRSGTGATRLNVERPGKGRIKLNYFD